jgi:hypothetical protein
LGGLGATDGPWVVSTWTPPSALPRVIPWLGLLCLLLLKPNRLGPAWWILAPVGVLLVVGWTLQAVSKDSADDFLYLLLDAAKALSFGLAAGWLVAGNLQWKHRFVAFAAFLAVVAPASLVAFLFGQPFEFGDFEAIQRLILVLVAGGVLAVALSLAGRLSRGRYSPARLVLWLVVVTGILWALVLAPFVVLAMLRGAGALFSETLMVWLAMLAFSLGTLLPFLVLTFGCGYYRERIKGFLHLGERPVPAAAPPPVS